MHKTIAIDSGGGVSPTSVQELRLSFSGMLGLSGRIHELDPEEIALWGWVDETDLFIIPGGRDLFYLRDLQGSGVDHIRRFVVEGGSYLGKH